jgi:hypothetical protein
MKRTIDADPGRVATKSAAGATMSRRRKAAFGSVAVVASLFLVEAAARIVEIVRPPMAVDVGQGFLPGSRVFVPTPDQPGFVETAESKLLAFEKQTFAQRKAPGTLRIAAIGGSSVRRLASEFVVLERQLREALAPRYDRVEVLNAGGHSYGSARLVLVADEMLEYEPDVVVLYEANNEFEELQQLHLARLDTAHVQRAASHSAAVRLLRDLLLSREIERIHAERRRQQELAASAPDVEPTWRYAFTPEDAATRMRAFHDNFASIIDACRAKGVPIVIGTMPSNLVHPRLSADGAREYDAVAGLLAQEKYDEAAALGRRILASLPARHQASDAENGTIRGLARECSVPLFDAEAAVTAAEPHHVPGETLFDDYCHLNARGNVILRQTIEATLVDVLRAPTARVR